MEMWAEYIKERLCGEVIYNETGFVTYRKCDRDCIFIMDAYIRPKYRRNGCFNFFVAEMYKREPLTKFVFCESFHSANGWNISDMFIKSWGMKPVIDCSSYTKQQSEDRVLYMLSVDSEWKNNHVKRIK